MLPFNMIFPLFTISLTLFFTFTMMNSWSMKVKVKKSVKEMVNKEMKSLLSLFISFDPKSTFSIFGLKELNWFTTLLILFLFFSSFWILPTRAEILKNEFLKSLNKQFSIALKSMKDGTQMFFSTIFLVILFCNFIGLLPNFFTPTSHLMFNLFFSVPLWMGFFLYGWMIFSNKMFAHLVPLSTPMPLISFMVLIESISTLIRPGTLSIRLMANMVSGHLLLTLMGNTINLKPILIIMILILIQTTLTVLEIGVSLIQAYVFCILLTLYSDESDYNKV